MSKPFDETRKHLLEAQPTAWLDFVGISGTAEVIDADLSTLAAEAGKVLRVTAGELPSRSRKSAKTSLLHLEFQSSYDAALGERTLLYNRKPRPHRYRSYGRLPTFCWGSSMTARSRRSC